MVIEARIRIRHRGCFTERIVGNAHGAQLAAERDADLIILHGTDPLHMDALQHALAAGRTRAPEIICRTPAALVLRTRGPAHSTTAETLASGCTIRWPIIFTNGEEIMTILAPTRDTLDNLLARLAHHGTTHLEHIADAHAAELDVAVPMSDITTTLTERQLIILQRAIAEGYYDSPRRTSTEALATTFGVTRSTLEEHLRKAERRVLEGFASVLIAQPVIARAATRRPGRPSSKPQAARPLSASPTA